MKRIIHILLIEDDMLDQMDVKRALQKREVLHRLTIATNGEEAIRLLEQSKLSQREIPDIVLLDLNMPKMSGLETLAIIRGTPIWRDVKIFILTTSDEEVERTAAYQYKISGFITKPLKLDGPHSLDSFNLMIDLMNI